MSAYARKLAPLFSPAGFIEAAASSLTPVIWNDRDHSQSA